MTANFDAASAKTSCEIRSTVLSILDVPALEIGELYRLCGNLYDQLSSLSQLDPETDSHRSNKQLNSGTAIGTTWAAMCIKDLVRTKKFYDGIYLAVKETLNKVEGRPLHIIYAGTGPFATLALPLFFSFSEKEIQFTLIEVNEESFAAMVKTIRLLGVSGHIRRYIPEDAVSVQLPQERTDILICETIQRALKKEPQVAILANLIPQVNVDVVLIPEEIRLDAAISDPILRMKKKQGLSMADDHKVLKNILAINKTSIKDLKKIEFPEVHLKIPSVLLEQFPELQIHSTIRVYRDIEIGQDESAITLPESIKRSRRKGDLIGRFSYQWNQDPGMIFIEE